jgi:hypothetical protein
LSFAVSIPPSAKSNYRGNKRRETTPLRTLLWLRLLDARKNGLLNLDFGGVGVLSYNRLVLDQILASAQSIGYAKSAVLRLFQNAHVLSVQSFVMLTFFRSKVSYRSSGMVRFGSQRPSLHQRPDLSRMSGEPLERRHFPEMQVKGHQIS